MYIGLKCWKSFLGDVFGASLGSILSDFCCTFAVLGMIGLGFSCILREFAERLEVALLARIFSLWKPQFGYLRVSWEKSLALSTPCWADMQYCNISKAWMQMWAGADVRDRGKIGISCMWQVRGKHFGKTIWGKAWITLARINVGSKAVTYFLENCITLF